MLREFKPLKKYFIEHHKTLIIGLSSLLIVDFLQILIPLVIKHAVDDLAAGHATTAILLKYAMIIVAIAFGMALFRYIWRYLVLGHSRKIEEALRNRLYMHLQQLSLSFYWRTKTGDLMARSVNDIDAVRMATGMGLVALTDGVVLGLATIGFMLHINVKLTLISIIPAPLIFYVTFLISRKMGREFKQVQQTFSVLTETVREALAAIRVVKAFNRQSWEFERLRDKGETYVAHNMELAKTLSLFFPVMTLYTNLGLAAVIWVGGRLAIFGDITPGEFVAFISYLNLLTWPMMALGWVTNLIQRGAASMKRINGILNETPEIIDVADDPYKGGIKGKISINKLTFFYPDEKKPALKDINLKIRTGQTAALVGRVGSGKSTLLHTIPRLIETEKGMVQIDNIPIHDMSLADLRKSIGFITQETHIFSDTILNNITFGKEGIDKDVINNAIEISRLSADISSFPEGINSFLGEKGVTLSGGQRQRLSIARALIANPPVLIIDDALSQVDTGTEASIFKNILEIREGKTNIIVSHRLSTIRKADRIYVLKKGMLIEEGDHNTLLNAEQEYAMLYKKQELNAELERGNR